MYGLETGGGSIAPLLPMVPNYDVSKLGAIQPQLPVQAPLVVAPTVTRSEAGLSTTKLLIYGLGGWGAFSWYRGKAGLLCKAAAVIAALELFTGRPSEMIKSYVPALG